MGAIQNPDDLHCRPVRFQKFDSDGSHIKTFGIFAPWPKVLPIGEIDVRLSLDGAIHVRIVMEDEWRSE
jgi:hypothetical protein